MLNGEYSIPRTRIHERIAFAASFSGHDLLICVLLLVVA